MKSVMIVIPAYNEEKRIGETITAVKNINGVQQVMVVDDGSTDNTADFARQAGAFVLELDKNQGKGGAMNAAIAYINTDLVVFLDADLGSSASEAELLIQALVDGVTDLVIAAFPPPEKRGGFGLVKGTAAWVIRKVGKIEVQAPLSGQRAMRKEVLQAVSPFNEGYGVELGMTIRALLMGFSLLEIPTNMRHNESGRDLKGFVHRGRQFIDILKVIKKEIKGRGL